MDFWLNPAVQKTLSLLLLIGIGVLLRLKIKDKPAIQGIKILILSLALPATIFIALLKIEVEPHLLFLPVLALLFNLSMLGICWYLIPRLGVKANSPTSRTLLMLLPSLAPGLSCFPFLAEYLGDEQLALAALADVGNKVFVLIILYLIAMQWYYTYNSSQGKQEGKLRGLMISLFKEPVNLFMICALLLLAFGLNFGSLPAFLQKSLGRAADMMTPLILLFIGLAVQFKRSQVSTILNFLLLRSGLAFLFSAILIVCLPSLSVENMLLLVVFPQSACSFWPFAHMSAVEALESASDKPTFDMGVALSTLALSLPISTTLILGITSVGAPFAQPSLLFLLSAVLIVFSFAPKILPYLQSKGKYTSRVKTEPVSE